MGDTLQVADSRGFEAGNWVELSHDALDLHGQPGTLVRIVTVSPGALTLDPASVAGAMPWTAALVRPKVRRWDQVQKGAVPLRAGAVPVREPVNGQAEWISLEDGVQIAFAPDGAYRSGDYWEVPARVATAKRTLRNLLTRPGYNAHEVRTLRGMMHAIIEGRRGRRPGD